MAPQRTRRGSARRSAHSRYVLGRAVSPLGCAAWQEQSMVAVAHTILVVAYHLLTEETDYQDLGPLYFDQRNQQHVTRRLIHRLEALGYTVHLDGSAA